MLLVIYESIKINKDTGSKFITDRDNPGFLKTVSEDINSFHIVDTPKSSFVGNRNNWEHWVDQ